MTFDNGLTSCVLCGEEKAEIVYGADSSLVASDYSVVRCSQCSLIRLYPQPDASALAASYDRAYYAHQTPDLGPRGLARFFTHYLPIGPARRGERLLDIGCGSGSFLIRAAGLGWEAEGLEVNDKAVQQANAHGLKVRLGTLEETAYASGSFKAITMSHSLEHMRNPVAALKCVHRLIAPGGRLLISVPNWGGLLRSLAGIKWRQLDIPKHLWFFDAKTLRALLEQCAFRLQSLRTVTKPGLALETLLPGRQASSSSLLKLSLLPACAAIDLFSLGDEIWVIAKAKSND